MSLTLLYTPEALGDLERLFRYISVDNPVRARSYIEEIQQQCRALTTAPYIGISKPTIREGLRILPFRRVIIIVYELPKDRVDILRIFSSRQDYAILLSDS